MTSTTDTPDPEPTPEQRATADALAEDLARVWAGVPHADRPVGGLASDDVPERDAPVVKDIIPGQGAIPGLEADA